MEWVAQLVQDDLISRSQFHLQRPYFPVMGACGTMLEKYYSAQKKQAEASEPCGTYEDPHLASHEAGLHLPSRELYIGCHSP
jgi:hypothetical protein